MTPARAHDLAALCRASRGAPLDRAGLIRAFTRGVLERGPVDPEALLVVLDNAGVSETAWQAAATPASVRGGLEAGPAKRLPEAACRGAVPMPLTSGPCAVPGESTGGFAGRPAPDTWPSGFARASRRALPRERRLT
jgi:hypothetical protein